MVAKGALAMAGKITECLIIANYYQVLHKQGTSIRTFTYTEGTPNMLILGPGKKCYAKFAYKLKLLQL